MKTLRSTTLVRSFVLALAVSFASPAGALVFINELHYDNVGTDAGEFIEVAGPAGTDLSAYSLVLYNGANGLVYDDSGALSGVIPNLQNGMGVVSFAYPVNGIQNGAPDGIALVHSGLVLQFLSYEGSFVAVDGPAAGIGSIDIGVSESGSEALGMSLGLQGSGNAYADFTWAGPSTATPGLVNIGQQFTAAVAEPATWAMLLAGLALLGFASRRAPTR